MGMPHDDGDSIADMLLRQPLTKREMVKLRDHLVREGIDGVGRIRETYVPDAGRTAIGFEWDGWVVADNGVLGVTDDDPTIVKNALAYSHCGLMRFFHALHTELHRIMNDRDEDADHAAH